MGSADRPLEVGTVGEHPGCAAAGPANSKSTSPTGLLAQQHPYPGDSVLAPGEESLR
jgi:hypothetical protein